MLSTIIIFSMKKELEKNQCMLEEEKWETFCLWGRLELDS